MNTWFHFGELLAATGIGEQPIRRANQQIETVVRSALPMHLLKIFFGRKVGR
jgi:hypothetical protein